MSIFDHINYPIFSQEHRNIISTLLESNQESLFSDWHSPGIENENKKKFLDSLIHIDNAYPGGVKTYIKNSLKLLKESKENKNPYRGFVPHNPTTVDLSHFNEFYLNAEERGFKHAGQLAFILVAGGLGERLGYSGIKINIPFELTTNTTYIAHYIDYIKSLAKKGCFSPPPLVIMTSPDTDRLTKKNLIENNYYGLSQEQIIFMQQELVPTLKNNEAHLAKNGPYQLTLKPHGHGDVHLLMHQTGVAKKLLNRGITHLVFIQDTNAQVCNIILPAFGVSLEKGFVFNSVGVPRFPGEAVGAIAKLVSPKKEMTINVEYNQLNSLLKESHLAGDIAGANGYSPFPGNTNVLLIALKEYIDVLEKKKGIISEFVNPKYADELKTIFKKPTRLETMMQDLPKSFDKKEKVGVTVFNRQWAFSANKNNLLEAQKKAKMGQPPESAGSAESDFYEAGRRRLDFAGNQMAFFPDLIFKGVTFKNGPRILLKPMFAITLTEAKNKIKSCFFEAESTLVLNGEFITLENVTLKKTTSLIINASAGVKVTVSGLKLSREGFVMKALEEIPQGEFINDIPEYVTMRGYTMINNGALIFDLKEPGDYLITKKAELVKKQ